MTAWGAASLVQMVSTTIQSFQTADLRVGSKEAVFCGDFRRYHSALSVSGDTCGLSGRFLASRLCIQKFRSPRQGFHGQYLSATGNMGVLGGQNRRFEPGP